MDGRSGRQPQLYHQASIDLQVIIEVNDCALTLMGESQEEDRRNIAELVQAQMEESCGLMPQELMVRVIPELYHLPQAQCRPQGLGLAPAPAATSEAGSRPGSAQSSVPSESGARSKEVRHRGLQSLLLIFLSPLLFRPHPNPRGNQRQGPLEGRRRRRGEKRSEGRRSEGWKRRGRQRRSEGRCCPETNLQRW